jgi:hypothetical protein
MRFLAGLLLFVCLAPAQQRVDPQNLYQRVICVVPIVGKGTPDDPKRPQYAPWPPAPADARSGIIAWSFQPSDDGKYALAEFVARDRSAFQAILSDKQLKVFEKGKDKKDDLEKELKKFRKDFDLTSFGTVLP